MKNFFYYISVNNFLICDVELCSESERTFDMPFFDLANNEALLNKLGLYYIQGNFGATFTYESRAKWFCGYLSAFSTNKDELYQKLITNPTVRLLITNDELLNK